MVPVPESKVQVATSLVYPGAVAVNTVLVLLSQKIWLPEEALVTDCVGAGTVILTWALPFTQGPLTVHLNT